MVTGFEEGGLARAQNNETSDEWGISSNGSLGRRLLARFATGLCLRPEHTTLGIRFSVECRNECATLGYYSRKPVRQQYWGRTDGRLYGQLRWSNVEKPILTHSHE